MGQRLICITNFNIPLESRTLSKAMSQNRTCNTEKLKKSVLCQLNTFRLQVTKMFEHCGAGDLKGHNPLWPNSAKRAYE